LSINVLVFVKELPSRSNWQSWLDQAGIPITLPKSLDVTQYAGFVPMKLGSYKGGVEVYIDDYKPEYLPEIADQLGGRTKMMTFSFSGDSLNGCCANGAAAALVKYGDGLAFYDAFLSFDELMSEFKGFLPEAKKEARQTPHKLLLDAVTKKLPHFKRKGINFFYLPIGQCARGFLVWPVPRIESFEVHLFVWPLCAHADRLFVGDCPTDLDIIAHWHTINQQSTSRCYWDYNNPGSVDELVDLATNKLVPYFESIEDPRALADALFQQFHKGHGIYDIEKTAMACAAVGKYDEALIMFERLKEISNPNLRFDYTVAMEERCAKIAEFIGAKRFEEIDKQLADWKSKNIKTFGIAGSVKKSG
jgi:hypothetical protein